MSRGIGGVLGAPRGCRGHLGCIGMSGVHWGLAGGVRGQQGYRGLWGVSGVHWEWQVDWEPNHIGPQSRVPALPLGHLGE